MNEQIKNIVLSLTGANSIISLETIQSLWSGYGEIIRIELEGLKEKSIVLKHVVLPLQAKHPLGWNTSYSHNRKVKSYQVEVNWYNFWSKRCGKDCTIPKCYYSEEIENEFLLILEDIDAAGFPIRKQILNKEEAKVCLKCLANFHATFLGESPTGLWETGTYWHLNTRPDELALMNDILLKKAAVLIDDELNNCQYKTFVHGDAKLENFCFSKNGEHVAAVDFQYVGGGCGMKDVVYFLESALDEIQYKKWEIELLDYYFDEMNKSCKLLKKEINFAKLEAEWRSLFPVAWADFYRFLSGWSPQQSYLNTNNRKIIDDVIRRLSSPTLLPEEEGRKEKGYL